MQNYKLTYGVLSVDIVRDGLDDAIGDARAWALATDPHDDNDVLRIAWSDGENNDKHEITVDLDK